MTTYSENIIQPKYKFFHKRDWGLADEGSIQRYIANVFNRSIMTSSDIAYIAGAIHKLPINSVRNFAFRYRNTSKTPINASISSRKMVVNVCENVLIIRERRSIEQVCQNLTAYQRVRILIRWIYKNARNYKTTDDDDDYLDILFRAAMVCFSLGLFVDEAINIIADNENMVEIDPKTEFAITFLEDLHNTAYEFWGQKYNLVEGTIYAFDYAGYLLERIG